MNHQQLYLMKSIRLITSLLCLLVTGLQASAQKVDFTADYFAGCPGLLVNFTNLSDRGEESYNWSFSLGADVNNVWSPSKTFNNPARYTITLTVKYPGKAPVAVSKEVNVYNNPVVKFNVSPLSACAGTPVQFTDQSNPGDGTISSIAWNFNDGSSGTGTSVTHTFTTAKRYNITSIVTNSHGCKSGGGPVTVNIEEAPVTSFTTDKTSSCDAPLTVRFFNTTPATSPLTYRWDFGDGTTDTRENPDHTYTREGSYTVTLVATTAAGCSTPLTKTALINIGKGKADFTTTGPVCSNRQVTLQNLSQPTPDLVTWTFPDGSSTNMVNARYTFPGPGTYPVTMTAEKNGCLSTVTKNIIVHPLPLLNPVAAPVAGCNVPFTTQFSAQSQHATQWRWDFGDGTTDTRQNPSHTYTRTGNFDVRLTATTAEGCTDEVSRFRYINIERPQVTIFTDSLQGCIPFVAKLWAALNTGDQITTWRWDFGDGTTSSAATPTHTYTNEGIYTISLDIITASGCTARSSITISTGRIPVVDFEATPLVACEVTPVQFTNKSVPRGNQWQWLFPQDNGSSSVENPRYKFNTIGLHDVTLIVSNNGCTNFLTKPQYIKILPPIARFDVPVDCNKPYEKQFTDRSDFGPDITTPRSWKWEFGDGQTSTEQHPLHTYAQTGTYEVKLTVSNGACESVARRTIRIIDEKPVIHADVTSICLGKDVSFTADALDNRYISEYEWDFGNNRIVLIPGNLFDPSQPMVIRYNTPGVYTATLKITDLNGCVRISAPITITVNGPVPDFSFSGKMCKLETIQFTDRSTVNTGNSIRSRAWDFGDGATDTRENPTHTYTNAKDYTVTLTVTDAFGCSDEIKKTVSMEIVKAAFEMPTNIACLKEPFLFIDRSTGTGLSYEWRFSDGTTLTGPAPQKIFTGIGSFDVELKVTSAGGCADSTKQTKAIRVPNPHAVFTVPANLDLCPPVDVQFDNKSTDFERVLWDFGDGSTATDIKPKHQYVGPGEFDVKLTVYSEGGCADDTTIHITIKGPKGTLTVTPTQGCSPLQVQISAQAQQTAVYLWDFDDGNVETTTTPVSPHHVYTQPGIYYPRVRLEDDRGCRMPATGTDRVIVDQAKAEYTTDAALACGGGLVTFTNKSSSFTQTALGLPFTSEWTFPDNSTSNSQNAQYNYTVPGTHAVLLRVTSAFGCPDDTIVTIQVPTKPEAEILPVAPICQGSSLQLVGRDNRNLPNTLWLWKMADGTEYPQQQPPLLTFEKATSEPVALTVRNADGTCPSTATANIVVHPKPALAPAPAQATLCQGSSLPLQANADAGAVLSWTNYNISDPASHTPVVTPLMDTSYTVVATNHHGCTNTARVQVKVSRPFRVSTAGADICDGEETRLIASGAVRYRWTPSTGLDRDDVAEPVAKPTVTTTYKVTGYGTDNCFTDEATAVVTVHPAPTVNAGPDITVATGSVFPLPTVGSSDIAKISWLPIDGLSCTDCLNPTATPRKDIKYHVRVENRYGCIAEDEIAIKLVCTGGSVFIPNSFSPNGDGQNDIFYIRGRGISTVKVFRIFNRWGQLLFERAGFTPDDPSMGWDGRFKGIPVNPDVFIYYAEMVCDTGESMLLKGNITLIK